MQCLKVFVVSPHQILLWTCNGLTHSLTHVLKHYLQITVRLEPKPEFGGLEIWTGYSYGLVCSAGFTDTEAKVACRQMGYPDGKALCCSAFGDVGKSIAIADLKCTGEEASVMDCTHTKTSICSSNHYASVVCSNVTDTSNGEYNLRITQV